MPTAPLPTRLVEAFFEIGYFKLESVFDAHEVARMREAFDRLAARAAQLAATEMESGSQFVLNDESEQTPKPIKRIVWCGACEPVLLAFGQDSRLVGPASQLLGSEQMHHLINQAHFKAPGDGVCFPWHQDSVHRRYGTELWTDSNGKGSYVQSVIALDDVTPENGPLQFVPRSCRHGHIDVDAEGNLPEHVLDGEEIVTPTMPAGSVLFFGPYTIHGSQPNRSTQPRRTLINGFAHPEANRRVYPGDGAGQCIAIESVPQVER